MTDKPRTYYRGKIPWGRLSYDWESKDGWKESTSDGVMHNSRRYGHETDWRDNEPFYAHLKFVCFMLGRSASYSYWLDVDTGAIHSIFQSDLETIIKHFGIPIEGIKSNWIGCKRGTTYGVQLFGEEYK